MVIRLMETAEAELEAAVHEAYAEGYKAGLLASLSDVVYYMALSENLQQKLDAQRRRLPAWASITIGFAGGFFSCWMAQR